MKHLPLIACFCLAAIGNLAASDALGMNPKVYHLGNSLIRNIPLQRLQQLFEAAGGSYDHGKQLGGGHKLYMHLDKRNWTGDSGTGKFNQVDQYGTYEEALAKHSWDALVMQPYHSPLDEPMTHMKRWPFFKCGSFQAADAFITYALGKTEESDGKRFDQRNAIDRIATERFYIYATWPGAGEVLEQDGEKTYAHYWAQDYNKGEGEHRRAYFADLVQKLNEAHPDLPTPVRMIPAGEVMAVLDEKIRADELPGIEAFFKRNMPYFKKARYSEKNPSPFDPDSFQRDGGILNVYADNVHMNDQPHDGKDSGTIGAYLAALTFYATLSGQSPVGLTAKPYEQFDAEKDAELITALQETVWEVVKNHPHTGLAE
jgi:hypothetical protein